MSALPYTYTICPPGPEPKRFTASCRQAGEALRYNPEGDLTINNRAVAWDSWLGPVQAKPFEERLHDTLEAMRKEQMK